MRCLDCYGAEEQDLSCTLQLNLLHSRQAVQPGPAIQYTELKEYKNVMQYSRALQLNLFHSKQAVQPGPAIQCTELTLSSMAGKHLCHHSGR